MDIKVDQKAETMAIINGAFEWLSQQLSVYGVEYNSTYNAGQISMAFLLNLISLDEYSSLINRNNEIKNKLLDNLKPQA